MVQKTGKTLRPRVAEIDDWQIGRTVRPSPWVAKHQARVAVPQDDLDKRGGKFKIDWHRHQPGTHGAVIRRDILARFAASSATRSPRARPCASKLRATAFAMRSSASNETCAAPSSAEVDHGGLAQVTASIDEIAQVIELPHADYPLPLA
jgi:hypothetical protein